MKQNHDAKKKSRILGAFLVTLCISGALAACGTADTADTPVTSMPQTEAVTEPAEVGNGRSDVADSLPDDLDFGGQTVRVLARGGDIDVKTEFYAESTDGEVVNDAVFTRNEAVEERLNIQMETILQDYTRHKNLATEIRKSVTAGSDDFELVADAMYNSTTMMLEGMFLDLQSLDYLDFSQPWWNAAFLETTSYEGRNYVCMGELSQTMISGAFCIFFNKTMFNEYFPDDPSLYETVNAGEWTLDKLISYSTPMYADLNGNGQADEYDRYGNYFRNQKFLGADAFMGGCNINLLEKNSDGSYTYNGNDERTVKFIEKMEQLLFEDNNTLRWEYNDDTIMDGMLAGQVMFTPWMMTGVNSLRDMKDDYGIIPMPKLDETQEDYNAFCHNGSTAFAIPTTEDTPDTVAAFLEAMSAETYRVVTPAYFETALKGKYSRDDETSQMLDLIVDGIYLDITYIFSSVDVMRGILGDSASCGKAVSTLAAKEKAFLKEMDKILQKYQSLE